jgi:hypothetical protein
MNSKPEMKGLVTSHGTKSDMLKKPREATQMLFRLLGQRLLSENHFLGS